MLFNHSEKFCGIINLLKWCTKFSNDFAVKIKQNCLKPRLGDAKNETEWALMVTLCKWLNSVLEFRPKLDERDVNRKSNWLPMPDITQRFYLKLGPKTLFVYVSKIWMLNLRHLGTDFELYNHATFRLID